MSFSQASITFQLLLSFHFLQPLVSNVLETVVDTGSSNFLNSHFLLRLSLSALSTQLNRPFSSDFSCLTCGSFLQAHCMETLGSVWKYHSLWLFSSIWMGSHLSISVRCAYSSCHHISVVWSLCLVLAVPLQMMLAPADISMACLPVTGTKCIAVNTMDRNPCPHRVAILMGGKNKINKIFKK